MQHIPQYFIRRKFEDTIGETVNRRTDNTMAKIGTNTQNKNNPKQIDATYSPIPYQEKSLKIPQGKPSIEGQTIQWTKKGQIHKPKMIHKTLHIINEHH